MNNSFALDPIHDENITTRDVFFGNYDTLRKLPVETHPYHKRRQGDQGNTNQCVLYSTIEILENKVFKETGRWYSCLKSEIDPIWEEMKAQGYANDSWGAYLNGALKVLVGREIELVDVVSKDRITVTVDKYFYIKRSGQTPEQIIHNIKMEIAHGAGVLTGLHTGRSKLDYYGANKKPYYVKENKNPRVIGHATAITAYNDMTHKDTVFHPGTWGDKYFDEGVAYYQDKHLPLLMSPMGFTIKVKNL